MRQLVQGLHVVVVPHAQTTPHLTDPYSLTTLYMLVHIDTKFVNGCMCADEPTQNFTHLFAFTALTYICIYGYGIHESLISVFHTRTYIYLRIPLLLYALQLTVYC